MSEFPWAIASWLYCSCRLPEYGPEVIEYVLNGIREFLQRKPFYWGVLDNEQTRGSVKKGMKKGKVHKKLILT